MSRRTPHIYFVGMILLLALLGFGIRLVNINESLWLDELHSSWTVAGSFSEVASRAADGNQAPLYYWVAWLVTQILGDSEFSERFLSIICGSALIPVVWWTVRRFTGSDIAAIAAGILVAFDPILIHYSVEFRVYIAVALAGVLQSVAFSRLLMRDLGDEGIVEQDAEHDDSERDGSEHDDETENMFRLRVTFVLLTLVLFYLHYTSILLLFFQIAITLSAICFAKVRSRYSLKMMLIDGTIIAVGCLPAVMHLIKIGGRKDDWIGMVTVARIEPNLIALLAGYVIPAGLVALSWVIVRGMNAEKSGRPLPPLGRIAIFGLGFLALIGITWCLTFTKTAALFHLRYVAAAFALPMVSIGLGIALFRDVRMRLIVATITVTVAFGMNYQFNYWAKESFDARTAMPRHRENWERAVREMNGLRTNRVEKVYLMSAIVEDHRLIGKDDAPSESFVDYCKFPLRGLYSLDPEKFEITPLPSFSAPPRFSQEQLAELKNGESLLIVARGYPYDRAGRYDQRMPAGIALSELHQRLAADGFSINAQPHLYGDLAVFIVSASKVRKQAD